MSSYAYSRPNYLGQSAQSQGSGFDMQRNAYYPGYYGQQQYPTGYAARSALVMGGVGAVVGGTASAAKNIRRVNKNEIDRKEAVMDTVKEATGTGLAVGLVAAVMNSFNAGLTVSLLGTAVVATGMKYVWDGLVNPEEG